MARNKIETVRFIRSAFDERDLVQDERPQVVFVGRSNVGKSSLLNRLLGGRKLARTSASPGRTRAINYFLINDRLYFVDLPGYGYAKVPKAERARWGELMERFFTATAGRNRAVQLVDAAVGATALDVQSIRFLDAAGCSPIVVATKIDKVGRSRRSSRLREIAAELALGGERTVIPFSARSGEGSKEVWSEIEDFLRTRTQST